MKNKLTKLLVLSLSLVAITCFALACTPKEDDEPQHVHDYQTVNYDEDNHWNECACGEKNDITAHVFVDGVCVCGYEPDDGDNPVEPSEPSTPTHTHNYQTVKYDEDNHWNECSCGDKKDVTSHVFVDGVCVCGYEKPDDGDNPVEPSTPTHTHNYQTVNYDEDHHWNECACGEKISVERHDWTMTKSTQVQTVYECTVCQGTKEYNLELGAKYSYTTIEIIIPETLSMEELLQTLPLQSVQLPREVAELVEQIGPIDTVEKYKTVLIKSIETGELSYHINNATIYVTSPLGLAISVTDDSELYVLTAFSLENEEGSEKVAKTENSSIFYQDDVVTLCFFDGKIQFKFEYLKGIEIIYNLEII